MGRVCSEDETLEDINESSLYPYIDAEEFVEDSYLEDPTDEPLAIFDLENDLEFNPFPKNYPSNFVDDTLLYPYLFKFASVYAKEEHSTLNRYNVNDFLLGGGIGKDKPVYPFYYIHPYDVGFFGWEDGLMFFYILLMIRI